MIEAIIGFGALILGVIFVGYLILIYNGFVRLKNDIEKAWANINVLLKQRSDELPKLIETVKGYMKHEKGLLTELTKARTDFLKAKTMDMRAEVDNKITKGLKTLFAVAENYPNLKANENFKQLQERISGLENELSDRREFYNESTNNYNIKRESFPDSIIANFLKLQKREMFEVTEKEKKHVKIKL